MKDKIELSTILPKYWKDLDVKFILFIDEADYIDYLKSKNLTKIEGTCTIGFGKNNKLKRIEVLFDLTKITYEIIGHELMHLTYKYSKYFTPHEFKDDQEEWLCIVNGWFTEVFMNEFNFIRK